MKTAETLLELIGRTPVLRLSPFEKEGLRLYAKLEGFNPTGSIKDRTAMAMIEAMEKQGRLKPGMTVVEASSGNTGIGLAMICRIKGYALTIVMSKKASKERIAILQAYGVNLVLTSKKGGADEARSVADQIAADNPRMFCRISQHRSLDNVRMHYNVTARELIDQVPCPIDYFVSGIGTSGTLMGMGRRIREAYPEAKIIGVQPIEAFNHQEGLRNIDKTAPPEIFDRSALDQIIGVHDEEAALMVRRLVESCGLLCGISSGSILTGALRLAENGAKGTIAMIFPDRGEKYLSTALYQQPVEALKRLVQEAKEVAVAA